MDYSFKKIGGDEEHLFGGVAYAVSEEPDLQGDFVSEMCDLWSGVLTFARRGSPINIMHSTGKIDATVVESFLARGPTEVATGETIQKGAWWLTVHVPDDEMWEKCKSVVGTSGGFSIEGQCEAVEVD